MLEPAPAFRPIHLAGGYPPLTDLGLIGDGATTALVGLDGTTSEHIARVDIVWDETLALKGRAGY